MLSPSATKLTASGAGQSKRLAVSGTSASTTLPSSPSRIYRIYASVAVHVRVGTSAPTALTWSSGVGDTHIPASGLLLCEVPDGSTHIAAIVDSDSTTTTGVVAITPVTLTRPA